MTYDVSDDSPQRGLVQRMRRYLYRDLVDSYREELDQLTAQAHEQVRQEIERTFDLAIAHTEERVKLIIDDLAQPLRSKEHKDLQKFFEELIEQRRQQLDIQVQTVLHDAGIRLKEAYSTIDQGANGAVERARMACEAEVDKSSAAIAQAGSIVSAMLENGAAKLNQLGQNIEMNYEQAAQRHRARLEDVSGPALDEFGHKAEEILRGLRESAELRLRNAIDQASADFAATMETRSRELLASWSARFVAEAQDAGAKLRAEISASAASVAEQNARGRDAMATALKRHAEEAVDSFRLGLQTTLQERAESGARDLEARFEEVERRHFTAIRENLAREIEEIGNRALTEAQTRLNEASHDACNKVHQEIGTAALALQRLTQQAENTAESAARLSFEGLERQVSVFAESRLGGLRNEADAVAVSARERLLQAAEALRPEASPAAAASAPSSDSPSQAPPVESPPT